MECVFTYSISVYKGLLNVSHAFVIWYVPIVLRRLVIFTICVPRKRLLFLKEHYTLHFNTYLLMNQFVLLLSIFIDISFYQCSYLH